MEEDDHEMMRIARYCTSVLISGRTIPVDVLLLIPLCDFFLYIADLDRKKKEKGEILLSARERFEKKF